MSLYNSLLGKNEHYQDILDLVKLKDYQAPRFRDAYLSEDARVVRVYTRTGGPNRESYKNEISELKNHPLYVTDYDDKFDNTFMTFEFKVPGLRYGEALELLKVTDTRTGAQKFNDLMNNLEKGEGFDNPRVKRVNNNLSKAFSENNGGVIIINEDGSVSANGNNYNDN